MASKGINLADILAKRGVTIAGKKLEDAKEIKAAVDKESVTKTGLTLDQLMAKVKSQNLPVASIHPGATLIAKSVGNDLAIMAKVNNGITFTPNINSVDLPESSDDLSIVGMDGTVIKYSERQYEAIELVKNGDSICIIGAAGTGKTTCSRGAIQAVMDHIEVPKLAAGHKYLIANSPGVVICSFTRRAVNNIRKVTPPVLKNCCITIHKLLEYQPFERYDDAKGKMVKRFEPNRTKENPLPREIKIIVIEEAGMVSTELFANLMKALPNPDEVQFIYLGDLYQLPPPMGDAILGYKMLEHRVVELDFVYRTGDDSPITSFAWDIKEGKVINSIVEKHPTNKLRKVFPAFDKITIASGGIVELRAWQQTLTAFQCNNTAAAFMIDQYEKGFYDPEQDIILCPFEKMHTKGSNEEMVSTMNINRLIADALGKKRNALVYEVIAREKRHYFAVGDKVLVDKEDGIITDIKPNKLYIGEPAQSPSTELSRHGINSGDISYNEQDELDVDALLDAMASGDEDVTNAASHEITIQIGDQVKTVTAAGEVNAMLFAYALTVYKAQGSEWRNVYGIIHRSHAVAVNNEMLYTLTTRARSKLTMLCESDTFYKGVLARKIKGRTLEEKSAFFRMKTKEEQAAVNAKVLARMNSPYNAEGKIQLNMKGI